ARIARPHCVGERLGARQTVLERRRASGLRKLGFERPANRLGLGFRLGELADLFRQSVDLAVADEQRQRISPQFYQYSFSEMYRGDKSWRRSARSDRNSPYRPSSGASSLSAGSAPCDRRVGGFGPPPEERRRSGQRAARDQGSAPHAASIARSTTGAPIRAGRLF